MKSSSEPSEVTGVAVAPDQVHLAPEIVERIQKTPLVMLVLLGMTDGLATLCRDLEHQIATADDPVLKETLQGQSIRYRMMYQRRLGFSPADAEAVRQTALKAIEDEPPAPPAEPIDWD